MCAWRTCCSQGWMRIQSWDLEPVCGTPVCTSWGQGPWWAVRKLRKEEIAETVSTVRAGCQSPAFWWGVSTQAVPEGRGERTASPSVSLSSSFIRPDISLPRLRCGLLMYQWGDFLSHQSSVWVGSDGNKITSSEMEQVIPVTWHRCQRGCAERNMSLLPSSSHQLFSYLGILPGGACAYFSQKTFYIFSCVYNDGIMLYALFYTWFFFTWQHILKISPLLHKEKWLYSMGLP